MDIPEDEDKPIAIDSVHPDRNVETVIKKEDSDGNPWAVNDASVFLRYCCPECDYNNEDLKGFSDHALGNHERSSTLFTENSNFNHQDIVPSGLNKSGVPLNIYVKQEEEQEQPDFEPY